MSTPHRLVALLAAALVLVTGCTGNPAGPSNGPEATGGPAASSAAPAPATSYVRYVALGDSFTAAPYVPHTDLAGGCLRSDGNYPSLVARRLDVDTFVDVSCSGADTTDLVRRQNTFRDATVPPQLDAVTADTDLVTLGIGGNDLDLFRTLLQTCGRLSTSTPGAAPCTDYLQSRGTRLTEQVDRIGRRVAGAIRRIHRRAPEATVLLVGYPRLAPESGTCPRLLPLAPGDYPLAERVARSLSRVMAGAAARTGAKFVDMYDASRGHDICSDEPWVNGRFTDQSAALAFHPFAVEMEAVADRLLRRLG